MLFQLLLSYWPVPVGLRHRGEGEEVQAQATAWTKLGNTLRGGSRTRGHGLCGSICVKVQGQAHPQAESRFVVARARGRGGWATVDGAGVLGIDENALESALVVAELREYTKNHRIVHLEG